MILTLEIVNEGKSIKGGWNGSQIALFGDSMKVGGWLRRIVGKDYPEETIKKFLELKDAHLNIGSQQNAEVNQLRKLNKKGLSFIPVTKHIPYREQYLHPNWQKMRLHVLKRDNYTCLDCGNRERTLHAHHLKYLKGRFVWDVPPYYIVTLCDECHSKEHGRDLTL